MDKDAFRADLISRRDREPHRSAKSLALLKGLGTLPEYHRAHRLLTYVGVRSEVETIPLIREAFTAGRPVVVPVVEGRQLGWMVLRDLSILVPGRFGVLEPRHGHIASEDRTVPTGGDLLLVPGVGFDRAGRRLGYGGGYYDRVLTEWPQLDHVALGFECQMVDTLPTTEADRSVRCLQTETDCYRWDEDQETGEHSAR